MYKLTFVAVLIALLFLTLIISPIGYAFSFCYTSNSDKYHYGTVIESGEGKTFCSRENGEWLALPSGNFKCDRGGTHNWYYGKSWKKEEAKKDCEGTHNGRLVIMNY